MILQLDWNVSVINENRVVLQEQAEGSFFHLKAVTSALRKVFSSFSSCNNTRQLVKLRKSVAQSFRQCQYGGSWSHRMGPHCVKLVKGNQQLCFRPTDKHIFNNLLKWCNINNIWIGFSDSRVVVNQSALWMSKKGTSARIMKQAFQDWINIGQVVVVLSCQNI